MLHEFFRAGRRLRATSCLLLSLLMCGRLLSERVLCAKHAGAAFLQPSHKSLVSRVWSIRVASHRCKNRFWLVLNSNYEFEPESRHRENQRVLTCPPRCQASPCRWRSPACCGGWLTSAWCPALPPATWRSPPAAGRRRWLACLMGGEMKKLDPHVCWMHSKPETVSQKKNQTTFFPTQINWTVGW